MVVTREVTYMKKLVYIVVLFTLLLSACGKSAEPKKVEVDPNASIEDVVKSVINGKYTVKDDHGSVSIWIEDKDVHQGSKSQMLKDSTRIFADLSNIKGIETAQIIWYAPVTGANGKEGMDEVLKIAFDEATFKKVDWSNYSQINIESIATEYKQSAAIGD